MKEKIIEYAKLVRLHAWGVYCLAAVYGALSVSVFDIWKLILLALIGVFAYSYGFALNDYADVSVDSLSKDLKEKPLVKGSIPRKNALYFSILVAIIVYCITLLGMFTEIFILDYKPFLVLTLAATSAAIYNFYGKKFVGSDIFVSAATALYCLFGAMVVSHTIGALTWIIMINAFLQSIEMNAVGGGLKDADHDYVKKTKNIAFRMGVKVKKEVFVPLSFKVFALLFTACSPLLMFSPIIFFKDFPYYIWQPVLMIVMLIGIFYITIKMVNIKTFDRNRLRKLISIKSFLIYLVVPVMLLKFVGYPIGLFLIFFPFIWYVVFNRLIYGNILRPKVM